MGIKSLGDLTTDELSSLEWHASGTDTRMLLRDYIVRACAELRRRRAAEPSFASSIAPHETIDKYLHETNTRTWLEHEAIKLGSTNQKERYAAGVLPQEELLALARGHLFAGMEGCERWKALGYGAVHHVGDCRSRVDIMSAPLKVGGEAGIQAMDHNTWTAYSKIINTIGGIAETHPWLAPIGIKPWSCIYDHVATCDKCKSRASKRSIKITIPWAGRNLVREYSL